MSQSVARAQPEEHTQQAHFYPGLDGLRAVMALWVLVGHVGNFMGWRLGAPVPAWVKPFLLTSVPVNVFICLSGFVIFQMLNKLQWTHYRSYISGRARRIFPIYWVAIAAGIAMFDFRANLAKMVPWQSTAEATAVQARAAAISIDWHAHIASHLALVQGLIPEKVLRFAAESILAPAWSLSLEWQFYVLAPATYFVASRRAFGLLGLVSVFGLLALLLPLSDLGLTPAFFLVSWPYFALGWWSSICLVSWSARSARSASDWALLGAPLVLILGISLRQSGDIRATALSVGLWGVAWMSCCRPADLSWIGRSVRAALGNRYLVAAGKRSYSLYLLHVLVLDAVAYALIRNGWLSEPSAFDFIVLLVPTSVGSLALAWFTYSTVERRFMQKSNKVSATA
jgi:peptidoglycan/LPS O-acetylase OafA/YrhL